MQMHNDEIALVLWTPMFLFVRLNAWTCSVAEHAWIYLLDCSSMDPSGGIGPNGTLSNTTTTKNCHFELYVLSWPKSSMR